MMNHHNKFVRVVHQIQPIIMGNIDKMIRLVFMIAVLYGINAFRRGGFPSCAVLKNSKLFNAGGSSNSWSPSSWKKFPIKQAPNYLDQTVLDNTINKLNNCSPLVFAGEVRTLQEELAKASLGHGFVLMGGDCAESFNEFSVNHIRDTFRVLLQMALVMTYGGSMPVIKIGRMAGQFAKPRSEADETRNSVTLPSYRGDIMNGEDFTNEARMHNPERMLQAYHQSAQTLNIIRALAMGGDADISRLHARNLDFVEPLSTDSLYRQLCVHIDESLRFLKVIGVNTRSPTFTQCDFYTAHEALLLPYEEALTRPQSEKSSSSTSNHRYYDSAAHFLWLGERTRQLDHAHVQFVSGIDNPIGIKLSEKCSPEDLVSLLDTVNPQNIPGRVTLIVRMGAEKVRTHLPPLIRAVQREGRTVLWMSDPMHGNTIKTSSGYKTRTFDDIRKELRAFFDIHAELGTHPGGVHLEMTGATNVTECMGGHVDTIRMEDLSRAYQTSCDPRLNGNQALELSFLIAERMRLSQGLQPSCKS